MLSALEELAPRLEGVASETPIEADEAEAFVTLCLALTRVEDAGPDVPSPAALLERARAVVRVLGDDERSARVAYEIGQHHKQAGRLSTAREVLEAALDDYQAARIHRPLLLLSLAQIARLQGRWDTGLALLDDMQALLFDEHAPDDPLRRDPRFAEVALFHRSVLRPNMLGTRAQLWQVLGLPDIAALALEAERELALELDSPQGLLTYALHRADLDLLNESYARVVDSMRAVLDDPPERGFSPALRSRFEYMLGAALAELARSQPAQAREAKQLLARALEASELNANERLTCELISADIALRSGEVDEAQAFLEAARRRLDRWEDQEGARFPLQKRAVLVAKESHLALLRGDEAEVLRPQLERLREAYSEFLLEWANTPRRAGGIGFLQAGSRRLVLSELIRMTRAVEPGRAGTERALEELIRAQNMGSLARAHGSHAPSLEEVRRALMGNDLSHGDHGVLVFLPAPDRTHLIAFDSRRALHFELASEDVLELEIEELVAELARRPVPGSSKQERERHARRLEELAATLSLSLLPPALRVLFTEWRSVTCIGAELLGHLPFECLLLQDGRLLGEALAVDHLPSLPVGSILARRPGPAAPTAGPELYLLACLDPDQRVLERWPSVQALDFDQDDARRLTRWYERATIALGLDASKQGLLGADLAQVPVVHLLAHGVYAVDRERGAALALARSDATGLESDLLWCEDVEAQPLSGLVILTACGTALGPTRLGEDLLANLGGAFLSAGARCVVLSRARIEYASNMRLMERFHEYLTRDGSSPAEAMRAARASLPAGGDVAQAFYLGQIQVLGLGQEPVFPRPGPEEGDRGSPGLTSIVLLLVGVALACALMIKKPLRG